MPGQAGRLPAVSIVVVSRHRPGPLAQCLAALARQSHPECELILVADPGSIGLRPDLPIKRACFDQANISAARNRGLALAAAEVVLFIDDDAVAAPQWAAALAAAFADPGVLAATGFTRGPDGLSWQARAEVIDRSGRSRALALRDAALLAPPADGAISTLDTNCGFRAAALRELGGFDPAFAYHLDESDVNMRMAARWPQGLTAVVPQAVVVHGIAPGAGRGPAGVPDDLTAVGRSAAIFAARHGGSTGWVEAAQRRRLLRLMVAGRLDPGAVGPVLATLRKGLAAGAALPPPPVPTPFPAADRPPPFQPLPMRAADPLFLAGWHWQARGLRRQAAQAVAQGRLATLLLLTPGFLPHRLVLTAQGWWEQRGGLWGRAQPGDRAMLFMSRADRIRREREYLPEYTPPPSGKWLQEAEN